MGEYGTFQAAPRRLSEAIAEMEAIVAFAKGIGIDLDNELRPHLDWMGVDDDYALEAGPKYRQNIKAVLDTHDEIVKGLAEIVNVRLAELKKISTAQGAVMESIDQGINAMENFDLGQYGRKR
ncbi:hypothetical protein ACFYXV_32120 [Streptomyces sp. NPDC002181]|uniref:hypothetical protein n=1 Tax=Streptomyces sp. NPDC002181 TaxID=3364635 RepID=UPI0036D04E61